MKDKNISLQELAKSKGKLLLIENFTVDFKSFPKNNLIQFDKPRLVESNGQQFQCRGILRSVPVTKFTENLNGRIYEKQLWIRVQTERMFEQGLCLADHAPDGSSGSVKNRVGIWHNFRVTESYGIADLYCIGRLGQELLESVAAGAKEGFSTVGFGELEEDKKTVNPNTFECAPNPCDNVIGPSQEVYATFENLESLTLHSESIDIKSTNNLKQQELIENNSNNDIQEKIIMPATLTKIEESHFRNLANQAIKQARRAIKDKDSEKLIEVQETLKETLNTLPEELKEERSRVDQVAIEVYDSIFEQAAVQKSELKEKTASGMELQEKLQITESTLNQLKEENKNLKEIKDDFQKLLTDADLTEKDVNQLIEDNNNRQKDMDVMLGVIQECFSILTEGEYIPENVEELVKKMQEYTLILRDNHNKMKADIDIYSTQFKKSQEIRNAMQQDLNIAVQKLKEVGYQFDDNMGPGYEFAHMNGVGQDNYSGFNSGSTLKGVGSAMEYDNYDDYDDNDYYDNNIEDENYMGMMGSNSRDIPGDMAYHMGSGRFPEAEYNQLGPHKDMQSGFSGPVSNADKGNGMEGSNEFDIKGVGSDMSGYGAQSGDGILNRFGPHSDGQNTNWQNAARRASDTGHGMRHENIMQRPSHLPSQGVRSGGATLYENIMENKQYLNENISYPESRRDTALREQIQRHIHQYFLKEVAQKPALKSIEQQVMNSRSLMEAAKIVEVFNKNEKDLVIRNRYNESRGNNLGDWLGKYR